MTNEEKDGKRAEALAKAIERMLGNTNEADKSEVDALFSELSEGIDPRQRVYELATKAAQGYRLQNKPLPAHVQEALKATEPFHSADSADSTILQEIVETALSPMLGPAQSVSYAWHRRIEDSEKDRKIMDVLSSELQDDWKGQE